MDAQETVDVLLGRATTRLGLALQQRLTEHTRRYLYRLRAATQGLGDVLMLPLTVRLPQAFGSLDRELRAARAEIESIVQWAYEDLRAQERGAAGDGRVISDAAHDRRAVDALVSIAMRAFEELGAAGGEGPRGHEERQQRDGDHEDQGEDGGASHGGNVRPLHGPEVSR